MKVLVYRKCCLIAWTLRSFSNFLIAISTGLLKFSVSLRWCLSGSTLSDLTASSKKVLNSSDKSKSSDIVRLFFYANLRENCFYQTKKVSSFSKVFYCLKRFSCLRTHNIFFFPFCITYNKSFYAFCIVWSVWVLLLRYIFSSWDLRIMAFLKVFVMYGAPLALRSFFFNGTCLFNTSMKVVSND